MKNRITRLFSIFIVISLLISSNIPVFANDETTNNTSNNVEIINADISQYPKFDINNFEEYKPILEKYGIAEDSVIAILPYEHNLQEKEDNKSAPEKNIDTSAQSNVTNVSVPAGALVLTGTYVSPYLWKLTVLNVGVLNVADMEADVVLINNSSGPIINSQRILGGLLKFKSINEYYSSGGSAIDVAIATVTGTTEEGEYFTLGGTQIRQ